MAPKIKKFTTLTFCIRYVPYTIVNMTLLFFLFNELCNAYPNIYQATWLLFTLPYVLFTTSDWWLKHIHVIPQDYNTKSPNTKD